MAYCLGALCVGVPCARAPIGFLYGDEAQGLPLHIGGFVSHMHWGGVFQAIVVEVASGAPIDDRTSALGVFYDAEARFVLLVCFVAIGCSSCFLARLHWPETRAKLGAGFDVRTEALTLSDRILRRAKATYDLDRKSRRPYVSRVSKVVTPPGSPTRVGF